MKGGEHTDVFAGARHGEGSKGLIAVLASLQCLAWVINTASWWKKVL